MFLTGMRFGEAAALKWQNVDMVKGEFKIVETYVRKTVLKPKTPSSVRIVKMAQTVKEAFRIQMKRTMGKSDQVFLNKHGRRLKADSVNNNVFKPTLRNAGLPEKLSCKDTRGTYITNAIDNQETLGFVQKQVGHVSTKMIVQHYYNHIPRTDDGSKLDEAFKQSEKVTRILPASKMER